MDFDLPITNICVRWYFDTQSILQRKIKSNTMSFTFYLAYKTWRSINQVLLLMLSKVIKPILIFLKGLTCIWRIYIWSVLWAKKFIKNKVFFYAQPRMKIGDMDNWYKYKNKSICQIFDMLHHVQLQPETNLIFNWKII